MFNYNNHPFAPNYNLEGIDLNKLKEVCLSYAKIYNKDDDKQHWFERIKKMAQDLNYAIDNKLYKQNPENYKGNVSDVCMYIRIAITGRKESPDLYSLCSLLSKDEIVKRLTSKF